MKLFIPEIGTHIMLLEPWSFKLYDESRNNDLKKLFKVKYVQRKNFWEQSEEWQQVTLPVSTYLSVDRIYIRKGVKAYSSLSFVLLKESKPVLPFSGRVRFWAKLEDVNKMEIRL